MSRSARSPGPRRPTPEEEAWLRDPRHPIHNGFRMHPVPNLIVTRTRTGRPHVAERYLPMSRWMRRHIVRVHYTALQKVLIWSGVVAMILTFTVAPLLLLGPLDCVSEAGRLVCSSP